MPPPPRGAFCVGNADPCPWPPPPPLMSELCAPPGPPPYPPLDVTLPYMTTELWEVLRVLCGGGAAR